MFSMTLQETIVIIIAAIGVIFTIISAVGIVRLPDVYARMHSAAKASTLGVSTILVSAGIHFPDDFPLMVVLIFLFFVTAPVATTTMARATYRTDPERRFVLNYDDMATMGQDKPNNQPRRRQTGKRK
jgi:multicomponent Na+:H+ antiporter subunit G